MAAERPFRDLWRCLTAAAGVNKRTDPNPFPRFHWFRKATR